MRLQKLVCAMRIQAVFCLSQLPKAGLFCQGFIGRIRQQLSKMAWRA
jgi:hypothetical protein